MAWFEQIFSSDIGTHNEKISHAVDKFHLNGEEKQRFKLELRALLRRRDSKIEQNPRQSRQSNENILVAELQQGNNLTKCAHPKVAYIGMDWNTAYIG